MPPTSSSASLLNDPLLSAHKSIRASVRTLLTSTDVAELERALSDLTAILSTHFEYEERAGGFISRLRRSNPGAADQLESEHRDILAALTAARAPEAINIADVRKLGSQVEAHEALENRLGIAPLAYDATTRKWRGYS